MSNQKKQNLEKVKGMAKTLAKIGDMKVKWKVNKRANKISVKYIYRIGNLKRECCVKLPLDKISSGKYSVPMVKYNVNNQLMAWLNKVYGEYKAKMSQTD